MDSGASTTVAIGALLSPRKERGSDDDPLLSLTQDKGVIPQVEAGRRNISSAKKTTYWRVYPDDIVYNTMRMWQGASARSDYFGIVSPAYTVCCPVPGSSARFLSYSLKLPENIRTFRARSQGLTSDVWNLHFDEFARIRLKFVPGYVEQERIATILSSVDDTIEKTQEVIDQVHVVKRGLKQELLTKGLPGRHERFRQTEIGKVPACWRLAALGEVLEAIEAGWSPKCEARQAELSEWGVLKVSSTSSGRFKQHENKALLHPLEPRPQLEVKHGDVLVARASGVLDLVGRSAFVHRTRRKLMLSDKTLRLRPKESVLRPMFLHLLLEETGVRRQILIRTTGSHMRNISQRALRSIPIPVPPLEEQERIEGLERHASARLEEEEESLSQLEVTKRALMSVLLSGELRVSPEPE